MKPGALPLPGEAAHEPLQPLQADSPVAKRAASLEPTKVEENAQDRYRFDELRNVTAPYVPLW